MPSDNRKTIYLSEPVESVIDRLASKSSASAAIARACDRYLFLVKACRPALAYEEWMAVIDCLNGYASQENVNQYVYALTFNLSDSFNLDAINEKWKIDGQALLDKVQNMTSCEKLSIVDVADQFWSNDWKNAKDYRDVLNQIGVVIES